MPDGTSQARSNGDLVEVCARMVRDTGRKVASVEEARKILSLGGAA
jgi:3-keto-5-aminohexanoate cleavage enzyme